VNQANLLGHSYFPNLISPPFLQGLHAAFSISAAMCVIAATASLLRGKRYIYAQTPSANEVAPVNHMPIAQAEASAVESEPESRRSTHSRRRAL
jgi:hypothetical protein